MRAIARCCCQVARRAATRPCSRWTGQGLGVAPAASLGQLQLARGEREVRECPAQEHGRVDVPERVAHAGQWRVDGGEVAADPGIHPDRGCPCLGAPVVARVTATGSTRIRRAAHQWPPLSQYVTSCTCPRPSLISFAARRPRLSLTTRTLPSLPTPRASSRRFAFDSGSASTRAPPVSQAASFSLNVTGAQAGAQAVLLAVPEELRRAALASGHGGREVVPRPVQHQVRDLFVPRQPLLPVCPEQLLQAEPMPRQCRGPVVGANVVRLLRRALAKVCPDLVQQDVVRRAGGAAEQLDLSRRRLQAQLHHLGHPHVGPDALPHPVHGAGQV